MITVSGIHYMDKGLAPYADVLAIQENLFNKNIEAKTAGTPTANYVILCEHPPVFTLGKSGKKENILAGAGGSAEFYQVQRGGDVTFHGPGQLVVYPILDLDVLQLGVAQYIWLLEETIIHSLQPFGIQGTRLAGAAGIWLDAETPRARKIAAIGARVSKHVTMHGLAVNVNTDLSYFNRIVPCGLPDKGVTSIQQEKGEKIDFELYKQQFPMFFEEALARYKQQ